jgi:hypothetical protein
MVVKLVSPANEAANRRGLARRARAVSAPRLQRSRRVATGMRLARGRVFNQAEKPGRAISLPRLVSDPSAEKIGAELCHFVISRFLAKRHPGFYEPVEQAQFWRTVDNDIE